MKVIAEESFEGVSGKLQVYHTKGGYRLRLSKGRVSIDHMQYGPYQDLEDAMHVFKMAADGIRHGLKSPNIRERAKELWD